MRSARWGVMRTGRGERRLGVALAVVLAALVAGACGPSGGDSNAAGSGAGGSGAASSGTSGGGGQDSDTGSGASGAGGPGQGGGGSGAGGAGGGSGGGGGAGGAGGAPGDLLWRKHISSGNDEEITDVAVDATGDVVIVGLFGGSVNFGGGTLVGAGSIDIFVVKLDAAGNHVWSKSFGGFSSEHASSVAIDPIGDVVVTGHSLGPVDFGGGTLPSGGDYDAFVVKLDAAGNHVWSKRFGDVEYQVGKQVAVDSAGTVFVAGNFLGSVDLGGGPLQSAHQGPSAGGNDIFVAALDAAGDHLWSKAFSGDSYNDAHSLAVDPAGNIALAGYLAGTTDYGGGPRTSAGITDAFAVKLDGAGNHLWSQRFGDDAEQEIWGLATNSAGDLVLTGFSNGVIDFGGGPLANVQPADFFVAVLDGAGGHVWSTRFGEDGHQVAGAVAVDGADNILLTGWNSGTIDLGGGPETAPGGGKDLFVAKLSAAGSHLWSSYHHGTGSIVVPAITADAAGNVFVAANFTDSLDIGGMLVSSGGDDALLGQWAP